MRCARGRVEAGWLVAILACVFVPGAGASSGLPGIAGICGIKPVLENTCLAVEIPLVGGEALAGFQWYNNDGTLPFARIVIVCGEGGVIPPLSNALTTLTGISGPSSGWGSVEFAQPVEGATDTTAYVVFVFPSHRERTGVGACTGPGFGLAAAPTEVKTHISLDGVEWTEARCNLAFVAIKTGAGRAATMSGFGEELRTGASDGVVARNGFDSVLPNPFNPVARIRFGLREASRVSLQIYDIRGQRVATLVNGNLPMGYHEQEWRGLDDMAHGVGSGVYLARLRIGSQAFTQRLSLVR